MILLASLFPTRRQWRNWSLPAKAGYASVWLAFLAIVITVVIATIPQRPLRPDVRALETEVVENLAILREKILVADDRYKRMLLAEEAYERRPPWLLPSSPYEELGPRLLRDLPQFQLHYLRATADHRISKDAPYNTYNRIYRIFEMTEGNERRRILLMNSIWESYEDMGAISGSGMPIYRKLFQGLLARDYVVSWGTIVGLAQLVDVDPESTLPADLQIARDVKEGQKNGASRRD